MKNRSSTSIQIISVLAITAILALGSGPLPIHNGQLTDPLNAGQQPITNAAGIWTGSDTNASPMYDTNGAASAAQSNAEEASLPLHATADASTQALHATNADAVPISGITNMAPSVQTAAQSATDSAPGALATKAGATADAPVQSVTNSDGSITVTSASGVYTLALNTSNSYTWGGTQTFNNVTVSGALSGTIVGTIEIRGLTDAQAKGTYTLQVNELAVDTSNSDVYIGTSGGNVLVAGPTTFSAPNTVYIVVPASLTVAQLAKYTFQDAQIPLGFYSSSSHPIQITGDVIAGGNDTSGTTTTVNAAGAPSSITAKAFNEELSGGTSGTTTTNFSIVGSTASVIEEVEDDSGDGYGASVSFTTNQTSPISLAATVASQGYSGSDTDSFTFTANSTTSFTMTSMSDGSDDAGGGTTVSINVPDATTVAISDGWTSYEYRSFSLTCNAVTPTLPGSLAEAQNGYNDSLSGPFDVATVDAILSLYVGATNDSGNLIIGGSSASPDATGDGYITTISSYGASVSTN